MTHEAEKLFETLHELYQTVEDQTREIESLREIHVLLAEAQQRTKENYLQMRYNLTCVAAQIYMNENGDPYDHTELMDFCMAAIGEPDDMSGELGELISEWGDRYE
tara:strand:- start:35679 stop:35996 length:318 start_codon:yes stop_codon:yes gene_type:complete